MLQLDRRRSLGLLPTAHQRVLQHRQLIQLLLQAMADIVEHSLHEGWSDSSPRAVHGLLDHRPELSPSQNRNEILGDVQGLREPVEDGAVLAVVESNESLVSYKVRSLIKGKVIEAHLTEGEVISDADHAFVIADLSEVWANFSVYQKDLPFIRLGQTVEIDLGPQYRKSTGAVSYISPILDEHTRTATARVILANPDGYLRPGLFVTGRVAIDEINIPIMVSKTSLQTIDGQIVVFVQTEDGFKPNPVHVGRTNEISVEILSGLMPGQEYVTQGGFTLKAQLAKGSFGEGHAH